MLSRATITTDGTGRRRQSTRRAAVATIESTAGNITDPLDILLPTGLCEQCQLKQILANREEETDELFSAVAGRRPPPTIPSSPSSSTTIERSHTGGGSSSDSTLLRRPRQQRTNRTRQRDPQPLLSSSSSTTIIAAAAATPNKKRKRSSITSEESHRKRRKKSSTDYDDDDCHDECEEESYEEVYIVCHACGQQFKGRLPRNHSRYCTNKKKTTENSDELKCVWCQKEFKYPSYFNRHFNSCRSKPQGISTKEAQRQYGILPCEPVKKKKKKTATVAVEKDTPNGVVAVQTRPWREGLTKTYCCSFEDCGLRFSSEQLMNAHHRRVGVFHRCETCGYECEWESSLLHHFASFHSKSFTWDPPEDLGKKKKRDDVVVVMYSFDPFEGEGFCTGVT